MVYYNFDRLLELKDGDILFFDELLNGNPVVLSACLTILEDRRMISGEPLPDIMVVAAANPQGMVPLTPQVKERFVWYRTKFDSDMWKTYMMDKYLMPKSIVNKLISLINKEDFSTDNFHTPRSIDKAVDMITNDVPTPYSEQLDIILNELKENITGEDVTLPDGTVMYKKDEMMPWLALYKHFKSIKNGNTGK